MEKKVTFKKIATGEFDVLLDGIHSKYTIVNGSRGLSGHGANVYGIVAPGVPTKWLGTLASCKKMVTFWLTKEAK